MVNEAFLAVHSGEQLWPGRLWLMHDVITLSDATSYDNVVFQTMRELIIIICWQQRFSVVPNRASEEMIFEYCSSFLFWFFSFHGNKSN